MSYNRLTLDDLDDQWRATGRWRLGAAPGQPGQMQLPVSFVFVHHTVTRATDDPAADAANVCDIDQHLWGKVSYSHNLHLPSRTLIECEGLCRGAHTINNNGASLNYISFGLGLIGDFQPDPNVDWVSDLSDDDVALIAEVIRGEYIDAGHTTDTLQILGHRDAPYATACPGDNVWIRLDDIRAHTFNPDVPIHQQPGENDMPTVVVRRVVANPNEPSKGYVLDARGGLHPFGGAPAEHASDASGHYWSDGSAIDVTVTDWSKPAGYVLDARGGLHPFGGLAPVNDGPYWPNAFVPPAPSS